MYKPGDVVNGHVLGHDNQWHPVAPPPPQGWPPAGPDAGTAPIPPGPYAASGDGGPGSAPSTPGQTWPDRVEGSADLAASPMQDPLSPTYDTEATQQIGTDPTQVIAAPAPSGADHPASPAQPAYPGQPPYAGTPQPGQPGYPVAGQPGYPTPPYGPGSGGSAPTPGRSKAWIWVVVVLVVLLGLGAVAVAAVRALTSGEGTAGPAPVVTRTATAPAPRPTQPTAPTTSAPTAPPAAAGQTATDAALRFTVTGVDCSKTQVGSGQILTKKAEGKFCLVALSITNTGSQPGYFTSFMQVGFDSKGRELDTDTVAEIYDSSGKPPATGTIQPGATIERTIIFDVATDATLTALELHADFLSDGAKITLSPV